jgi:hypothetical protein
MMVRQPARGREEKRTLPALTSEGPKEQAEQAPKEQACRSVGSFGVKFNRGKSQLPSLSSKTKLFVDLRAALQRFEDRSIKLLTGCHHLINDPGQFMGSGSYRLRCPQPRLAFTVAIGPLIGLVNTTPSIGTYPSFAARNNSG